MKTWIQNDSQLASLNNSIGKYVPKPTKAPKNPETHDAPKDVDEKKRELAAKKIQHLWRGYKVKETLIKDSYGSYMSMVARDDEQYLLSARMFGQHQAELRTHAKDRISNPNIHDSAWYHRCDYLNGPLLDELVKQLNIPSKDTDNMLLVPVTISKTVSYEAAIRNLEGAKDIKIVTDKDLTIALLLVPKEQNEIRAHLVHAGLIATPWEIAKNIKTANVKETEATGSITLGTNLPKTKEELLQSDLFIKLIQISKNNKLPTHHLAGSLVQLLKNKEHLTADAIRRVALLIDLSNTFYTYNYPRYAFCMYAIIHELSLSIAMQADPKELDKDFDEFVENVKTTSLSIFGLDESQLDNSQFIASPALSGTNAFMIAKRIALTMHTKDGKPPSVKMLDPCYFELGTSEFTEPEFFSDPDIYIFSAGPIVNLNGLTPGKDINLFVRDQIINKKREKPTTIILDATTTLYKNLHLDADVQKLVDDGMLSIIVFESHQKFGLLHSDQAQYGRVFGWCSTKHCDTAKLQQIQADAKDDYKQHMDMRIGATLDKNCGTILEEIKKQHFSNGAIFKNIFTQAKMIAIDTVKHSNMLTNMDELYFNVPAYSWEYFAGLISFRNSFGHYATTLSFVGDLARLCANASDETDALIISARIYLAITYRRDRKEANLLEQNRADLDNLSPEEQIITLAMANNIVSENYEAQPTTQIEKINRYCLLNNVLQACESLKGRDSYQEVAQSFYTLKQSIIDDMKIDKGNPDFLSAVQSLYDKKIDLSEQLIEQLHISDRLCTAIKRIAPFVQLSNDYINVLLNDPSTVRKISDNPDFFIDNKNELSKLSSLNVHIEPSLMISLISSKERQTILKRLVKDDFPFSSDTIKMLENRKIVACLSKDETLDQDCILVLAKLNTSSIEIDNSIIELAKNNEQFRQLVSLVYDTTDKISTQLSTRGNDDTTYKKNIEYSPVYLRSCFTSIKEYCTSPRADNKQTLVNEISEANSRYSERVLSDDWSLNDGFIPALLRGILKFVAVIVASSELLKYASDQQFFKTKSETKLTEAEPEIEKIINPKAP